MVIISSSSSHSKEADIIAVFDYYAQIQLLVKQMNVTFQDFFIPIGLAFFSNALIFVLYVCIKLHDAIPMPGFLFFPLILTDALLVIGVDFASAGFVHSKSNVVIAKWKMLCGFKRRTQLKTKAHSFPPLKIRFGMNFIDEMTSLTILDFCLNQTVSLLLMS